MKKGFTLIELLAVIVILAIIALIATPIVLNMINGTKESSQLRSAENYLDAVENSIKVSRINGTKIADGTYKIMQDGNICLGKLSKNTCDSNILEVEVSGKTPTSGTVTIKDGGIKNLKFIYEDKIIKENDNGELVFSEKEYEVGDEVVFDPGDGKRTWNVIGEDKKTVTLLLNENIGDTVWISLEDYCGEDSSCSTISTNKGPITALTYLNTLTSNWNNVDPINNYEYINNENGTKHEYGYQKLNIVNGVLILTSLDGSTTQIVGETKARFLSEQDFSNIYEEAYRTYIEKNFEELKNGIEELERSKGLEVKLEATTVDELVTELEELGFFEDLYQYEYLFKIVITGASLEIDTQFLSEYSNEWFNVDLKEDSNDYWSACSDDNYIIYLIYNGYGVKNANYKITETKGIRPVIIVLKEKL